MLFNYIIFAVFSTVVNLSFQYISFMIYSGFLAIYIAMFFGTLSGLIVKYILDKKFIFNYETKTKKENLNKFMLYSLMGVFTTIIFWFFEVTFDYIFHSEIAKYIGAIIGLSIGYSVKYLLDKKFVFKKSN